PQRLSFPDLPDFSGGSENRSKRDLPPPTCIPTSEFHFSGVFLSSALSEWECIDVEADRPIMDASRLDLACGGGPDPVAFYGATAEPRPVHGTDGAHDGHHCGDLRLRHGCAEPCLGDR